MRITTALQNITSLPITQWFIISVWIVINYGVSSPIFWVMLKMWIQSVDVWVINMTPISCSHFLQVFRIVNILMMWNVLVTSSTPCFSVMKTCSNLLWTKERFQAGNEELLYHITRFFECKSEAVVVEYYGTTQRRNKWINVKDTRYKVSQTDMTLKEFDMFERLNDGNICHKLIHSKFLVQLMIRVIWRNPCIRLGHWCRGVPIWCTETNIPIVLTAEYYTTLWGTCKTSKNIFLPNTMLELINYDTHHNRGWLRIGVQSVRFYLWTKAINNRHLHVWMPSGWQVSSQPHSLIHTNSQGALCETMEGQLVGRGGWPGQ